MNDDELEPFLLLAAVLAVVLGVVIFWARGGDDAPAPVVGSAQPAVEVEEEPLPTAEPAPAELTPANLRVDSVGAPPVVLSGAVPDEATRASIVEAAEAEYGVDNVVDQLTIDDTITMTGGTMTVSGVAEDADAKAAAAAAFAGVGVAIDDQVTVADLPTLGDIAAGRDDLTQLSSLLAGAGLSDVLTAPGPVTIFAPTDDAIAALDPAVRDKLQDPEVLSSVLQFHVVDGVLSAESVLAETSLTTLQGESIAIDAGVPSVAGATILETDLEASNGVMHIIERVMLPGTVSTELQLAQLVLDPIQFASGSADLLPESITILDEAAAVLNANTVGQVEIQGHTDSQGDDASNLTLSQLRAEAVRTYLISQGVDGDRLSAVGFGETRLKVIEETDADRFQNRRIEFLISN